MKPKVSIIIVSYNVRQLLFDCLSSLNKFCGDENLELIVVDNDSADDSCEMVRNKFSKVILIANNFNAGFSGANNQGMKIASGDYIFLLNPDTELEDNSIGKLVDFAENHPEYSLIAPRLLNSDHSLQISVWKNPTFTEFVVETFYLHKLFNNLNYPLHKFENSFEAETVSGAAMFFKRSLMEKIGMLDENLFWMEDIDFSVRAGHAGKIYYFREAVIVHHSGQSQKKNYDKSIANQLISKLKFYRKYNGSLVFTIASVACFIFILSRLLIFGSLSPFKLIYRLKAKAYFYTWNVFFDFLFLNKKGIV